MVMISWAASLLLQARVNIRVNLSECHRDARYWSAYRFPQDLASVGHSFYMVCASALRSCCTPFQMFTPLCLRLAFSLSFRASWILAVKRILASCPGLFLLCLAAVEQRMTRRPP